VVLSVPDEDYSSNVVHLVVDIYGFLNPIPVYDPGIC